MPPSPSMRYSPVKERKRSHSFESELNLKPAKDDDLVLFNDMQSKEREGFLLEMNDDIDGSIAKLRYFSEKKLGINIPSRGESSDLLNADENKTDYDWLLTPPDTPLFSSLDDDVSQHFYLAPRGRMRSQPIVISRSSMSPHRTSRSSASPGRLSPSPRSSSSIGPSRERAYVPHSSSPGRQRSATPSRRPSTPPNKPSMPTQRSITPTPRRASTGSSCQTSSSTKRGGSPMKSTRGNSASPKLGGGWQSNLQGFPSDAPLNLRTSLSDRPASYVRGSSPASRNGRDSSSYYGRRSVSPSASRSGSTHSYERDGYSSYSRRSVALSGDDDADSLHSATAGISVSPTARKNIVLGNSKSITFSKKPSRAPYTSSAPKRSFDSAVRQMDQHKAPRNMFRPLLSSVSSTTFTGKGNNSYRRIFSRNSSLTTTSNASSEQGMTILPNMEEIHLGRNDINEWQSPEGHEIQKEIFAFDKVDEVNELQGYGGVMECKAVLDGFENTSGNFDEMKNIATSFESSYITGDSSKVDNYMLGICSRCGSCLGISDWDGTGDICQECAQRDELIAQGESTAVIVAKNNALLPTTAKEIDRAFEDRETHMEATALDEMGGSQEINAQEEYRNDRVQSSTAQSSDCLPDSCPTPSVADVMEQHTSEQNVSTQITTLSDQIDNKDKHSHLKGTVCETPLLNNPEGTGISILLQRSGSIKWPVVQGRLLSTACIHCSEPSYVRDNMSSMKHSISRDGGSTSSVDLRSSSQSDPGIQHQLIKRKADTDSMKSEHNEKTEMGGLHRGVVPSDLEARVICKSENENFESSCEDVGCKVLDQEQEFYSRNDEFGGATTSTDLYQEVNDNVTNHHGYNCKIVSASDTVILNLLENDLHENSAECCVTEESNSYTYGNSEHIIENILNSSGITDLPGEEHQLDGGAVQNETPNAAEHSSSVVNLVSRTCDDCVQVSQAESAPSGDGSNMLDTCDCSTFSDTETSNPSFLSTIHDHEAEPSGESTVTLEGQYMSKSLTLAEATDTILLCSSIIHDIAYKAATIGIEKELTAIEAPRMMVNMLGKSVEERRDSRLPMHKSTPKSLKFKRKRLEADSNVPVNTESTSHTKVLELRPTSTEVPSKVDSVKPPKLESRCNCTIM